MNRLLALVALVPGLALAQQDFAQLGRYADANAALEGLLFDGMLIAAGGFGLCGIPENLIAAIKAADEGLEVGGSVMASDAFFPFRDGIDAAHEAGIVAVIQPGGSMRDDEVIAAAEAAGMSMVFTGTRHFRH